MNKLKGMHSKVKRLLNLFPKQITPKEEEQLKTYEKCHTYLEEKMETDSNWISEEYIRLYYQLCLELGKNLSSKIIGKLLDYEKYKLVDLAVMYYIDSISKNLTEKELNSILNNPTFQKFNCLNDLNSTNGLGLREYYTSYRASRKFKYLQSVNGYEIEFENGVNHLLNIIEKGTKDNIVEITNNLTRQLVTNSKGLKNLQSESSFSDQLELDDLFDANKSVTETFLTYSPLECTSTFENTTKPEEIVPLETLRKTFKPVLNRLESGKFELDETLGSFKLEILSKFQNRALDLYFGNDLKFALLVLFPNNSSLISKILKGGVKDWQCNYILCNCVYADIMLDVSKPVKTNDLRYRLFRLRFNELVQFVEEKETTTMSADYKYIYNNFKINFDKIKSKELSFDFDKTSNRRYADFLDWCDDVFNGLETPHSQIFYSMPEDLVIFMVNYLLSHHLLFERLTISYLESKGLSTLLKRYKGINNLIVETTGKTPTEFRKEHNANMRMPF